LWVASASFLVRMFAITGFYHRYFSHQSFRTSRAFQALMAFAGGCAAQRDPMWWASHHAQHHLHSDALGDPHSPSIAGFLGSHAGWFMTGEGFKTRSRFVRHWERFPELRLLNRFDWVPPLLFAALVYALGAGLERFRPGLGTNGAQMLVWGFFIATVCLYHATFTVNSLAHGWGRRRFATGDDSRNNWLIALLTLGEGWHNNHHHCPGAARQGFYWWEIDLTFYGLLALSKLGLVWDLRPVPQQALGRRRIDTRGGRGAA
ncbi:MAG: acyl-CoA desaturase, partial [Bryobacterales bacterium]|nr:acyl-CoA desaturase [Bryobacterales bacterium]